MGKRVRQLLSLASALTLVFVPVMVTASASAAPIINEYPIPSNPNGSFPESITQGPNNALWFTIYSANAIGKVTPDGNVVEYNVPTPNAGPVGITTASDGTMWFTETSVGKIGHIDSTGNITEYPLPSGYEVSNPIINGPNNTLWFNGDYRNSNGNIGSGIIGRITTSGDITVYSTGNTAPGWITLGPDGAIWFTSVYTISADWNTGIGRFDTSSGSISAWYPLPSSSWFPSGITTGPDHALWFTDGNGNNKVGRITVSGDVSAYPIGVTGSYSVSITTGPDGALWFTDTGTNSIGRVTTSGVVNEYPVPTSRSGPQSITSGSDGALWFVENSVNKIGRLLPVSVPSFPTNLTASSPAQFPFLSWTASSGATSYNIYRNGANVGSTSNTTYTDTTAPEGTDSYTVTAVNSAGESPQSNPPVSVLVDRTAPTITYSVSPTPNSAGWNKSSPVTVTFTCADNAGGSGIASCSSPQTESFDGSYTLSGTAVDNAGNSATVSVTVNLDQTAPTLGAPTWSTNPILVGSGNSTLTIPASDNLSGVTTGEYYIGSADPGVSNATPMTYASGNLTAAIGSNLTAGVYTISYRAKDAAGNWSTVTPSTTTMLVITDPSTTLGVSGKNKKDLVPDTANGDVMPGLVSGATDAADYGMTVQYKNGSLDPNNGFVFNYSTGGTNCGKQNAQGCQTFALTATSFDWMTTGGTNNSQAWFQGTANVTVNGVTTSNKFWVEATDGNRLTPTTNNYLTMKVYAPGADPSTATPIYQASGSMSSTNSVKIQ